MFEYVISAFIFGISAGIKPGPLGIFIIQQTLEHGVKQGMRASLAPVITDGPIILAALVMLTQFKDISAFIGILSCVGGCYLLWLSLKMLRVRESNISKSLSKSGSLATAIKVNFLSPNPYLFWFTVGGTYLVSGTKSESAAFILVSIGTLVAAKALTAWVAANFREFLDSKTYVYVMNFLGAALAVYGLVFIVRGQNLLLSAIT